MTQIYPLIQSHGLSKLYKTIITYLWCMSTTWAKKQVQQQRTPSNWQSKIQSKSSGLTKIISSLSAALQIRASQRPITANLWPLTAHICHVMIIVTGGFSRNLFLLFSEAAVCKCSSKQVLLKILQYSQKHICVKVTF